MEEVVSCRLTREEKRLAQALAARREQFVAELLRELLVGELNQSFALSGGTELGLSTTKKQEDAKRG